jgi:hypothetical protein
MPTPSRLLWLTVLVISAIPSLAQSDPKRKVSPKLLSAKSIYFDDQTGVPAVGKAAVDQVKKWGRFQIVADKKQADLLFLLSSSPPRGGHIIYSGGQTGTIEESGRIEEDPVPNYHKSAPVRDAYLTVFDTKTGESLWSASRQWGGLLTGFNSAGARLVDRLKSEMRK